MACVPRVTYKPKHSCQYRPEKIWRGSVLRTFKLAELLSMKSAQSATKTVKLVSLALCEPSRRHRHSLGTHSLTVAIIDESLKRHL